MSDNMRFRIANAHDYDALGEVMFEAIHHGPTHYTKAQSLAWAATPRKGRDWQKRLRGKHTILAEQSGTPLGFMTIESGGYIDFAYIRPAAQGSGLFRSLYELVEDQARTMGEAALSTHASLMAQPAFAAMGFVIDHHETVETGGQHLARARMIKTL